MDRERDAENEPGGDEFRAQPPPRFLQESAAFALPDERLLRVIETGGGGAAGARGKKSTRMKTSVYLDPQDVERLAWLADLEERPQAEIIRDAIRAYTPPRREREFLFFDSGEGDGRSIIDIPDEELMRGFGADAWGAGTDSDGDLDR